MKVAIVGAGIGGLSLALMLVRRGIECEIFEATAEIKPRGAGINLLPHAMKALSELGLDAAIAESAIETQSLADCPRDISNIELALQEYEAERLPRTAGIVLRHRMNGPEQVMQIAHERAPNRFNDIDQVIPFAEREAMSLRYKRLAGFDPQALQAAAKRRAEKVST